MLNSRYRVALAALVLPFPAIAGQLANSYARLPITAWNEMTRVDANMVASDLVRDAGLDPDEKVGSWARFIDVKMCIGRAVADVRNRSLPLGAAFNTCRPSS